MLPITIHNRFDDFDHLRESAAAWDLDFLQIDRGRFNGEILVHMSSGLEFGRVILDRRILQRGQGPAGCRSFAIPARSEMNLEFRREQVGADDLLVFPADGELYSISEIGFDMYVVSFPVDRIEASATRLRLPVGIGRLLLSGVHRGWPGMVDNLQVVCRRIESLLRGGSNSEEEQQRVAAWSDDLLDLLLLALVNQTGIRKSSPTVRRRSEALDRALEAIESVEGEPISLSELCRHASVSERTLQYAFRERLSVSPKQYIQSFRLNRVRRELRSTMAGDILIADVANQFGFWHLGQFAADYRQFFGELPSETPRRM